MSRDNGLWIGTRFRGVSYDVAPPLRLAEVIIVEHLNSDFLRHRLNAPGPEETDFKRALYRGIYELKLGLDVIKRFNAVTMAAGRFAQSGNVRRLGGKAHGSRRGIARPVDVSSRWFQDRDSLSNREK